jgi:hypothetical protein
LSRSRLEELEQSGLDLPVVLVWLASGDVPIPEAELKATRRRAMLVLASGGDPSREIDLGSVATERLGTELDTPERRAALAAALDRLTKDADGLPAVEVALHLLRSDADLAWRSLALALLADELAGE